MAQITEDQVREVVESMREGLTYLGPDDGVDAQQRRRELLGVVGFSLQQDLDILFDLLGQGVRALSETLNDVEDALDVIDEALPDVARTNTVIVDSSNLQLANNALQNMSSTLADYSRAATGRKAQVASAINAYLEELKPSISEGTTFRYPGTEAQSRIMNSINTIAFGWEDLIGRVDKLVEAVNTFMSSRIDTNTALLVIQRVQEEVDRIQTRADSRDPLDRANDGIDDFIHLIVARDLLDDLFTIVDPRLPKVSGDTLESVVPVTPATLIANRSAPYYLNSTNNQLTTTLDEVNAQTQTLPTAAQAQLPAGELENYTIQAATKASASATIAAPYTNPVRASAADGVTTINEKYFTSALANFITSGVLVGDHIIFSGAYTGTAYVTAVIDANTLLLDTAFTATAAGVVYNMYPDNRFRIYIRGTLYTVPLTIGTSLPFTTWKAELIAGLTGVGTVTDTGGLINIEDAGAAGEDSTLLILGGGTGSPQALMGFPTTLQTGAASTQKLKVKTDTGTQEITMAVGVYTAAALVTHMLTLMTATIWTASSDNGRVIIKSTSTGPNAYLEVQIGNAELGFFLDQRVEGSVVHAEDIEEYLNANQTNGARFDYEFTLMQEGDSMSTAASSNTVTDLTANFTTLGVQVGDVLVLLSGPVQGYFHIISVGTTALSLDTNEWLTASAVARSNLQYRIERNRLVISSLATTLQSAVLIGAGSGNTQLGFTAAQEARGQASKLRIVQNAATADPEELGLTDNDRVSSFTPVMIANVVEVSDTDITIEGTVDNNFSSSDFSISSRSAESYNALASDLQTWVSTQKPRVIDGLQTLDTLTSFIIRAVSTRTPVYIGEATGELAVLRDVLFNASTGLEQIFDAFVPAQLDETIRLQELLQEEGADRMLEYLREGLFREALSTAYVMSSRVQHLSDLLRRGGRFMESDYKLNTPVTAQLDEVEEPNE